MIPSFLNFKNNIKFYFTFLKNFLKNIFKEFSLNLLIICSDFRKFISFLLFLPIIFYLIKIQILIGFIFFILYCFIFLIVYNFLKTNYEINCREIPLNTSYIIQYSIINSIFLVPKAKAYILFYNLLYLIWNKKNKHNFKNILLILILGLIVYIIKLSIILLIGYTFLSLYITSDFVIKLFKILSWNFETKKALFQHVLLNCFLDNVDSVGRAEEMNIIIKEDLIIFNMKKIVYDFFSNIKKSEVLINAYHNNPQKIKIKFVNGHYTWSMDSDKYYDKNLTKNLTSTKKIVVKTEDNKTVEYICRDTYKPNLKDEDKENHLTPTYELNNQFLIICELKKNMTIKMQNLTRQVQISFLEDRNEKIIYSENSKFMQKDDAPTVSEYCKEYKVSLFKNIEQLDEFEKANTSYLNTEQGKQNYEIFKKFLRHGISIDDKYE